MRNLLVVDDEPGMLTVLSRLLADEGWTVSTAHDGAEALLVLGRAKPDAVLLDYIMPRVDGAAFVATIRRDPKLSIVPVIVMSGLPEPMIKRKVRHYAAFIRKPFQLDELLVTLDRAVPTVPRKKKR